MNLTHEFLVAPLAINENSSESEKVKCDKDVISGRQKHAQDRRCIMRSSKIYFKRISEGKVNHVKHHMCSRRFGHHIQNIYLKTLDRHQNLS